MSNNDNKYKIACLIDYDNFSSEEYLKLLFEELNEYGDVLIKEAYFTDIDSTIGNEKTQEKTKDKFIKKLLSLGISPKIQLPYTTNKNAADIRIAIEAMDLLSRDYITCFCLATSDSDLTPLAIRLKKENKFVIGAGIEKTPNAFKVECNFFINIDTRIKDKTNNGNGIKDKSENTETLQSSTKVDKKIKELVVLINELIEESKDERGLVQFSQIIETLKKRRTDFSPKNYGFRNKNVLPFFKTTLKDFYIFEKKNNTDFIGVIKKQ